MKTEQILTTMRNARELNPQIFTSRKVKAKNGKEFVVLSRSVEVTMVMDGQPQKGLLIFGDQSPNGHSNDAIKVLRGEQQAKDVQWLYFKDTTGSAKWLGKIAHNPKTNEISVLVLLDVLYDKEKKTLSLVLPDKIKEQMPI
jgi:hypothetical protein